MVRVQGNHVINPFINCIDLVVLNIADEALNYIMKIKNLCLLTPFINFVFGRVLVASGGQSDLHREKLGDATIAVKRFHSIEDFDREIYILNQLKDIPLLLQPLHSDQYRREIVFPFLSEGDLTSAKLPNMTFIQLARISRQLVSVVARIHERDILHLDIKPENILLANSTSIRLIDVGLAHPIEHAPIKTGTPQTMSPEALDISGKKIKLSEAADWWSVGVTIFYMFMRHQAARSPRNLTDCHYNFYPYRLIYGDQGHVVKMTWPEKYPPFPDSLLKLLYGSRGLLAWDPSMRLLSGDQLLSHPFFAEYCR